MVVIAGLMVSLCSTLVDMLWLRLFNGVVGVAYFCQPLLSSHQSSRSSLVVPLFVTPLGHSVPVSYRA